LNSVQAYIGLIFPDTIPAYAVAATICALVKQGN